MLRFFIYIIFLAASVTILLGPAKSNWQEITVLQKEKEEFNATLDNLRELKTLLDQSLSQYKSISSEDIERLNKMIPSQAEIVEFSRELTSRVNAHGLSLKGITANQKESSDTSANDNLLDEFSVVFSVTGSYNSFLSFINDLSNSLRIIDINKLFFISSDTDLYEFTLEVTTYWKNG